ncbi:MAG: integrase core domain-containing protein [Cytophagales bacterium]|nr:integrase core domain-containing protein [Cytophagales bacterium]
MLGMCLGVISKSIQITHFAHESAVNAWMSIYNNEQPHSSLGYLTPAKFLLKYGKLHHPQKDNTEFTSFQQDGNYDWKFILSNVTN